jgi:hypothetical protein
MSFTNELMMLLKAAPTITATAKSTTFPFEMKAWNSLKKVVACF